MPDRSPFDIGGPLPTGLSVLEASAGTGKTYALSALAVRFVAEFDTPASALCIVSFTEAATAELRGRVRARLVEVADALETGDPAAAAAGDDPVLAAVARVDDPGELQRRIIRLRSAVADFDAATITTIHGFCGRVLAMAGDGFADVPIERGGDDVDEVVNDLLIACAAPDHPQRHLLDSVKPTSLARAVATRLTLPDARMQRYDPTEVLSKRATREPERRARSMAAADLVDAACAAVLARRAATRRRTLDRVVVDTRDLVVSPDALQLVAALRARYRVVLIDEFQDTDRVQWDLFHRLFVGGEDAPAVVLVGDPKQSIYRFRGAELSAYLDALACADSIRTLDVNRRSDGPVLTGLERLFDGFTFGADSVRFQRVVPAPDNHAGRLDLVPLTTLDTPPAPIEIRVVPRHNDVLGSSVARRTVRDDVVAVVRHLLGSGATIDTGDRGRRPLQARDVAVLTRSNREANLTVADLGAAGIAAATAGATSVLDTAAMQQWKLLFDALERPGSARTARAAALGWFVGHTAVELAAFDDADLAALHELLRDWSALVARRGVAALLAAVRAHGVGARLLARRGGERDLTDVEHIAELMQQATRSGPASAASVRRLLADPGAFGDADDADSVVSRRIDRDDDAVQVLTAHRAKGLEFGVVLCPYLWAQPGGNNGPPHAATPAGRLVDPSWVAGQSSTAAAAELRTAASAEAADEQRRLLYVALTRAKHRCIMWWAPLTTAATGVLGEVLQHAHGGTVVPVATDHLRPLVESSAGTIAVTSTASRPPSAVPGRHTAGNAERPELAVAATDRVLDRSWRVWSFSSVKSAADAGVGDVVAAGRVDSGSAVVDAEVPVAGGADEPPGSVADAAGSRLAPQPLASAPGGTEFGTLVHHVLEQVDFTSPTLLADLTEQCAASLRYRSLRIDPAQLAAGLAAAIDAPLGGPVGDLRLRQIPRTDRLDELVFDMPLGRLRAHHVGAVLADHLPADDLLAPWARSMTRAGYDLALAGMLTGSIDLVARTDGGQRFWVADYKTNQLGPDSGYTRAELAEAMAHHHYPLQAVLYLVALHRLLRWRLVDYRPDVHLGGAAYLFLRGMDPSRPADAARGVFWWQPPVAAIEALDRLLAAEHER
jgi:exodeoxyribonuclease V beta subunit